MNPTIKAIAIHLPQFHPIPENDEWWGKGFTEWANVAKAQPLFKGHYQPHLPADLGFYDLRLEEARVAQAELAKKYGIYGFCYYHYWFNGKRLLNRPLDDMLKTGTPDFPFMLCWANENWTRRWDGADQEILMEQNYTDEDHRDHATFLCKNFFQDKRYIRINGKPVFIFYKANLIPNLKNIVRIWKETCIQHNLKGLYLLCMDNFTDEPAEAFGFDGSIHFHPDFRYFKGHQAPLKDKVVKKITGKESVHYKHHVEDYEDYFNRVFEKSKNKSAQIFPGITPMWDNTARKKKGGIIFTNSSPEKYGKALSRTLNEYATKEATDRFLFINAWNEWAEGNHLEPCVRYAHRYLEETYKELKKYM